MPTLETTAAFFGISLLLALTPGPDNLFVLLHSALHGRKAGMLVVLGLCTGLLVHTAGVVLGLAALFAASATAFTALKLCGAAYLVFLAWQAFRAPSGGGQQTKDKPMSALSTYGRGFIMNVTNPKVVIFFLAFLPQFANPKVGHIALQMVFLGLVFIVATLLTFGAIACFADGFGTVLRRSPRIERTLNQVAGCVFLGLAAHLVLARR